MKSNHEYKLEESRGLEQKLLKRYGDFEHVEKIFHWWMKFTKYLLKIYVALRNFIYK